MSAKRPRPSKNELQVYAPDVITVGQYFFDKMLREIGSAMRCKPEDRYKYTNPIMFINYLRSLPLKPSQDDGAFQLSETGCAVLDGAVKDEDPEYQQMCMYVIHQAWHRIQLKFKPSLIGHTPVMTQIILYELWSGGHTSFINCLMGHGYNTPGDPASGLRSIEAGEYCDLLKSVVDSRMAAIVNKGNFDALFPQQSLGQDATLDAKGVDYLMQVMNEGLDKLKAAAKVQPELVDVIAPAEHYAMLIFRVFGCMRLSKVDKTIQSLTPSEYLEKPPV